MGDFVALGKIIMVRIVLVLSLGRRKVGKILLAIVEGARGLPH